MNQISTIKINDIVTDGCNCGLHVLLNIEHFICISDEFLKNPLIRHLNVNIKRYYEREEATKLTFVIVNLLNEITRVVTHETRQAYSILKNS